jgi:hypothetical protein
LLISTLRNYVEAMGGDLQLIARFPDRPAVAVTGLTGIESKQQPSVNIVAVLFTCTRRRDNSLRDQNLQGDDGAYKSRRTALTPTVSEPGSDTCENIISTKCHEARSDFIFHTDVFPALAHFNEWMAIRTWEAVRRFLISTVNHNLKFFTFRPM